MGSRWTKVQEEEKRIIESNKRNLHYKSRLFGFLAGDGNVFIGKTKSNCHHTIRFFPDHDSLIGPFCESLYKVYGKIPSIKKLHNMYWIVLDSKIVVQDIIKSASFGVKNWRMPYELFADRLCEAEWLRAFFDCEAYVSDSSIRIQTVNEAGTFQIKESLRKFGIESKQYLYHPKNKNWSNCHILVINNKNKTKYLSEIGFNHSVKLNKLVNTLKVYK